jgi:hypothetical protein
MCVALDALPGAGEIVFSSDAVSGCASMTWRYHEWRVITRLDIMPVPFTLTAQYNVIDTNLQVFYFAAELASTN